MVRTINHVTSDWKVEEVNVKQIEVVDKPDDITKRFEQNDFTFKAGEKVFITSRCSIPRAKIKQSFKEKGLKITHVLDEADHIIVDRDFVEYHTQNSYSNLYKQEKIEKMMNDSSMIISRVKDKLMKATFKTILEELVQNPVSDCLVDYRVSRAIDDAMEHACLVNQDGEHDYSSERGYLRTVNKIKRDFFMKVLDNIDKVILEDKLIGMTNNEIHMDKELFDSLCKYMQSEDKDNILLAMETMANCNYESSALYLLLLIEKYGYKMRDSKVSNYVNFKSMMRFFNISRYKLDRLGYDDILDILKSKNLLNQGYIDIITPLVFEEMQSGRTFKWFSIKAIQMTTPKEENEDDENED